MGGGGGGGGEKTMIFIFLLLPEMVNTLILHLEINTAQKLTLIYLNDLLCYWVSSYRVRWNTRKIKRNFSLLRRKLH